MNRRDLLPLLGFGLAWSATSRAQQAAAPASRVRQEWLDRHEEPILEPDLPIIDPHHHLWERPGWRYLLPELLADVNSGHNIVATVYIQARSMYRASGPMEMRPVGETEFANGIAAMSASGLYGKARIAAGIVGHADLTLGARVEQVLSAHLATAKDRFRGIRHITAWDADTSILNPNYPAPQGLLGDKTFREGFAVLDRLGLSFDAWLYHPQIGDLANLASAFPNVKIVLDHLGTPVGTGAYRGRSDEVFSKWKASIKALAERDNVYVKLGGLGQDINALGFSQRSDAPDSVYLAATLRPYIETCIEAFGTRRSMFESNFPVDKPSYSYPVFWNACKVLAKGASTTEKADLFSGTATRFYRLDPGS